MRTSIVMALAGGAARKPFSLRRQSIETAANDVEDFGPPVERLQSWSKLALAHGAYFLLLGGWSLLRPRTVAEIVGPGSERLLDKAVGASLANVGIQLIQSALHGGRVRREVRALAVRMAITFAAFDFSHRGLRRRVSPLRLGSGAMQLLFAGLWVAERLAETRELRRAPVAAHA